MRRPTISSSKSSSSSPSSMIRCRAGWRRCGRTSGWRGSGIVAGRLSGADDGHAVAHRPSRPARVSSQLPPVSAARSTITEPGRMRRDHRGGDQPRRRLARDQRGGDDDVGSRPPCARPAPAAARARLARAPSRSRRRPRASSTSSCSSTNARAEALDLLAAPPGRTSNAATTAPSRRAVAIACRPATPAPMHEHLAPARIVPAAVISIGKNLGSARRRAAPPCSRRPSPATTARPSTARG